MAKTFIDTNILFYTIDDRDQAKHEIAVDVVSRLARANEATISVQVAHELASNIVSKLGQRSSQTIGLCQGLRSFSFVPTTLDSVDRALLLMEAASLSFWDACIVAAATSSGCRFLFTEDLNHGQVIAGVEVRNPFLV